VQYSFLSKAQLIHDLCDESVGQLSGVFESRIGARVSIQQRGDHCLVCLAIVFRTVVK
jgi:hypothetical protein